MSNQNYYFKMGRKANATGVSQVVRMGMILAIIAISVVFPALHTHAGQELSDAPGDVPQHHYPFQPDADHEHDHRHNHSPAQTPTKPFHSHPDHYHQRVDFELTRLLPGSTSLVPPVLVLVGTVSILSDTPPKHSFMTSLAEELIPNQFYRDNLASRAPPLS